VKKVVVPVPDLPGDQFERVAETLEDMGFASCTWTEAVAPPKPNARCNVEHLRKYGFEFTDIRRFELDVPADMPLIWVTKMVKHALRDCDLDVEPGSPITLE